MKQFLDDHQLINMTVPTVQREHHQVQLRRVLVSRANQQESAESLPYLTLKGISNFMNKRTITIGAGFAGVLAIAVIAVSIVGAPGNASALQLAHDGSQALLQVSLQDKDTANLTTQEATYEKYTPQFATWLSKAQQASDLHVLSYDQVLQAYPNAAQSDADDSLKVINNPRDGQMPNVHDLKYLAFTLRENGGESKIVVGINGHDVPEAALLQVVTVATSRG